MPTQESKDALLEQLDKCDPQAWKALVAYCVPQLINEQVLLAGILCREAERRAERASHGAAKHYPADHLATVLQDVGLRLELEPPKS